MERRRHQARDDRWHPPGRYSPLSCTMPFEWYARLIPTDLDALVAFVRTVKPLKTP